MGIEALKKIAIPDYLVDKVQSNTAEVLQQIAGNELLEGKLFKDVSLVAGKNNTIKHNLGRVANWIVVRKLSEASDIWEVAGTINKAPKSQLLLDCTVSVKVNLYLF